MPKRGTLSVAVAMLGIFLIVTALPEFPLVETTYYFVGARSDPLGFTVILFCVWFGPLLAFGFGVRFIWSRNALALRLIYTKDDHLLLVTSSVEREDVLAFMLLGIGAWLLVHGLGDLVRLAAGGGPHIRPGRDLTIAHSIAYILEFLIGLMIYCQPRQMARWIEWFQR
jgi:hypothetical protein